MFRILRWTVLGLLLVTVMAPALQAQSGGSIPDITTNARPDGDPNGTPYASSLTVSTFDGLRAAPSGAVEDAALVASASRDLPIPLDAVWTLMARFFLF